MSDKGILFSAPMVRALLDGRKTQTRRLLTYGDHHPNDFTIHNGMAILRNSSTGLRQDVRLPYAPGDRLYVREAWSFGADHCWSVSDLQRMRAMVKVDLYYRADCPEGHACVDRWFPSIHMPRWASRLWLNVTDVRVERLQAISDADCIAEGIDDAAIKHFGCPVKAYAELWDHLHGGESNHGWSANPWIIAVTFSVHAGNIDKVKL